MKYWSAKPFETRQTLPGALDRHNSRLERLNSVHHLPSSATRRRNASSTQSDCRCNVSSATVPACWVCQALTVLPTSLHASCCLRDDEKWCDGVQSNGCTAANDLSLDRLALADVSRALIRLMSLLQCLLPGLGSNGSVLSEGTHVLADASGNALRQSQEARLIPAR